MAHFQVCLVVSAAFPFATDQLPNTQSTMAWSHKTLNQVVSSFFIQLLMKYLR